jgi:hypothetical protein
MIKNVIVFLRYPSEGFYRLKRNTRIGQGVILCLLALMVRIAAQYITHEPLRTVAPSDTSFLMESTKLLLPLLSWVIVSYALSSIRNGECKLRLAFVSCAYCLLPFIILTIPIALISNLLSTLEADIYAGFLSFMYIWMLYLFYKQIMETNNYSFRETVELILLSLFGVAISWAVLLTLYVFILNVWTFLKEILIDTRVLMQ